MVEWTEAYVIVCGFNFYRSPTGFARKRVITSSDRADNAISRNALAN